MTDIEISVGSAPSSNYIFSEARRKFASGLTRPCTNSGPDHRVFTTEMRWLKCAPGPIEGDVILIERKSGQLDLAEVEVKVFCQQKK